MRERMNKMQVFVLVLEKLAVACRASLLFCGQFWGLCPLRVAVVRETHISSWNHFPTFGGTRVSNKNECVLSSFVVDEFLRLVPSWATKLSLRETR